jgi:hypothetical protein
VSWNALAVSGQPTAAFHRRSKVIASVVSESDMPCSVCSTITDAITSAGTDGRPAAREQVGEHRVREQLLAVLSQKGEHTPGLIRCPTTDSASNNSR